MITVNDVIKASKEHPTKITGARHVIFYNNSIDVSIVGGGSGLYGDFNETFEVAVIDRENKEFVTKFFFPENSDDVVAYMDKDDLVSFLNTTFHSGFQVR